MDMNESESVDAMPGILCVRLRKRRGERGVKERQRAQRGEECCCNINIIPHAFASEGVGVGGDEYNGHGVRVWNTTAMSGCVCG